MSAPEELPREATESTITTLFCDGETRALTFRRRKFGLRFYTMRLAQALLGQPYPERESTDHDQHALLVTLVEKDSRSQEVVRTINSGVFTCEHV